MIITRKMFALAVASLVALAPACAKKSSSGSSSSKDEGEDEEDGDDADDGTTSTKKDTNTCDDTGLVDDGCGSGDDENKMDPDSDFYSELVLPTEMKACNDNGFVFIRCNNECSTTIKTPPKFKCDRAGIEATFSTVQGAKEMLADYLDNKKYVIDQCGVTAAKKPFVALVCFTKDDGVCVGKDDLDSKGATAEVQFLTTDTAVAGLCKQGAGDPATP